jgi:replication factor C subunit 3/5
VQVIEPVRSRCLCVRVAAPSNDQICQMISHIAEEEDLEVPPELVQRLAKVRQLQTV